MKWEYIFIRTLLKILARNFQIKSVQLLRRIKFLGLITYSLLWHKFFNGKALKGFNHKNTVLVVKTELLQALMHT